ncbi:MAG TPA: ATP-binding cassette domain-containing protein [Pseudonocardiaceae bacterium]|nr:ATP-binding cassette domain-containing protein [Pseudonocardiaceae bacterium]
MLSVRDVVVGYRRGEPVLDGVDLQIEPGHTVGLAGPSGCGKSTLARVLALLLAPWRGAVSLDGQVVPGFRYGAPVTARTAIGLVFQQPRLAVDPRATLHQVIAEPLRATRRAGQVSTAVTELAERVGLTPELLGRAPHEVSDGQLQRACLARALVLAPRYLLCDEMTAMVDASTTAALVGVVRDEAACRGVGVLAISHDEELLDVWADRVVSL